MAGAAYGSLQFQQQLAFFRRKKNVLTERWTDVWQEAHDHAFMVAGANRIDLLLDLRDAVDRAIAGGSTLEDFRKDFDAIVARYGWTYNGGRNWRTRVIFETNLRTSYAAGRYEQLQRLKKVRPYWRYLHSDSVQHPRPLHLAWNGLVLHADNPWWNTHYPPNGWGCQCSVEALDDDDLRALGKSGPDTAPPVAMQEVTVGQRGPHPMTVQTPAGVDPGFGYAPGRDAWLRRQAGQVEARAQRLSPEQREKALAALEDIRAMREALPAIQDARRAAATAQSARHTDDEVMAIIRNAFGSQRATELPFEPDPDLPLSRAYQYALHVYTDKYHEPLNRQLRFNALSPQMRQFVEVMDEAVQALPARPGEVFRAIQIDDAHQLDGLLAKFGAAGIDDEPITFPAYTSASRLRVRFAGNVVFRIIGINGRDIAPVSSHPGQNETIFPRGTRFVVVGLPVLRGGRWYIDLREISP